jgi:MinD superfamily P-loop ATPase
MRLAIASGKGGTGKTTLSVAIAKCAGENVTLLDCDVEEPNSHIFLDIKEKKIKKVTVPVPVIDEEKCTHCGKCAEICQFNAIVSMGGTTTMVFNDLCHSCGGCQLVCPEKAITEVEEQTGELTFAKVGNINFIEGKLNVGKAMSPPVIRAVLDAGKAEGLTVVDSPPGTSCPMIAAVNEADYILLVTEPTPFGLNDLILAVETVRGLGIPFSVAINRFDAGDDRVEKYCLDEDIDVALRIPDSRKVAVGYSKGLSLDFSMPQIKSDIRRFLSSIKQAGRQI